ncbi:MAG: glycosyltransferase family 4 protein [Ignisphaera sp.]
MNILWINHRDPRHPDAGGAEVRFREIARRLVKMGYKVTLLCEKVNGLPSEEVLDGIRIKRIGDKVSIHLLALKYASKFGCKYDLIIDDIAHAVPWFSPIVTRTPVIAQVHHVHQEVLYVELPKHIAFFVAQLERTIPKVYSHIIAVSRSTKEELINKFNINRKNIFVVPNGVDLSRFKPGPKDPRATILWIGRIKKYKNLEDLLYAYRMVEYVVKNTQLIVIGTGDYEPRTRELSKNLRLKNIKFLGRVSEEEKIVWMQRAWIIVSTSIVEGWGMTITEAAACGTPAVAYNVPGLRDSIIHMKTGILVEPRNLKELVDAITSLLIDENLRMKLSENAYRYSQRLDWDLIACIFARIIEKIAYR